MYARYRSAAPSRFSVEPPPGPGVEERLDRLLIIVRELAAVGLKELDAVVLGRVVRSRDDCPEILRQESDGGSGKHTREDRGPSSRGDAPCKGALELEAGRACIAPHEDTTSAVPSVAAFPSRSTRSGVRLSPTIPRTPSVPRSAAPRRRNLEA